MANPNKPMGLTPVRYLNGADWDGKGNMYCILAADTNAFYPGDPVVPSASGGDTGGIPACTIGTPGSGKWLGVVLAVGTLRQGGPYIDPNNLTLTNRPSGAQLVNYYALVCDDPNIIYEIQEDSVGGSIAVGSLWNNANLIAAAPATGVKVSGYMLDSSTAATTNTLDLKVLRAVQRVDNAIGTNCKFEVVFNTHFFGVGYNNAITDVRIGV